MALERDPHHASFELTFRPSVEIINLVRRFVSDFYVEIIGDADTVSRLALATHELLENAARYGIDGQTRIQIDVDPRSGQGGLVIRVENRAEADHREALGRLLEEMRRAPDPMEHYCEVMRRNAKRSDGSGLGLARIRAEAGMRLEHEVLDDHVSIIATTSIPEGEDP